MKTNQLKRLEDTNVLGVELSSDYKILSMYEANLFDYDACLDKDEVGQLIDELREIHEGMVDS